MLIQKKTLLSITKLCKQFELKLQTVRASVAVDLKEEFNRKHFDSVSLNVTPLFSEEERGQKRKRELDEEAEEDEDD